MGDYPRILYGGPADQSARTCFVHSDAQLALALSQGWRRRRVPEPVIEAPVVVVPVVTAIDFDPDPTPTRTHDDDVVDARSDPPGDPDVGDHAAAIPVTPPSARPPKKTKKKKAKAT